VNAASREFGSGALSRSKVGVPGLPQLYVEDALNRITEVERIPQRIEVAVADRRQDDLVVRVDPGEVLGRRVVIGFVGQAQERHDHRRRISSLVTGVELLWQRESERAKP
jgi:hypothetical protein